MGLASLKETYETLSQPFFHVQLEQEENWL
jgi:hypothetical protein